MSATRIPRNPRVAKPHLPKDAATPGSWIVETGGGSGSGGGGLGGGTAPPVSIEPPAEVIFRSDHRVEVDVEWNKDPKATAANFLGAAVYLEDPDISTGKNYPLDGGSMPLDGTAQVSGKWQPVLVNNSFKSPAVLPNLDSLMGAGQSYKSGRNIRIYLAAFGPFANANPVRATDPNPTPNILVYIPQGRGQGESGQEWAFLVTLPQDAVTVNPDYNRLVPKYSLTLKYTPPDPGIPVPPGVNHFGGARIVFVQYDNSGNPIFPGSDTGMSIPVAQADSGFKSDDYEPSPAGGKFRVYFCSEDDAQPLGSHVNSLVDGTTPWADAIIPPVPGTPLVTNFTISNQTIAYLLDGSFEAQATFAWHLPDASNNVRYAGVFLYLVNVTGTGATLTKFPRDLSGPQSNTETGYIMEVPDVPATIETWTIAAISYSADGKLAEDPTTFGAGFKSPTVTWDIGGPPSAGNAPLVTLGPGATAAAAQTLSADGVGMVSFSLGPWVNPTDNNFGNAQVAMVINHDTTKPTMWTVPANATSFVTPAMPSFGNIGSSVSVDFYLISDDPQGNKNPLVVSQTPKIPFTFTPAAGAIIPARSGWFDESQFSWVTGSGLTADNIEAKNIYVGRTLVVGGAPDTSFAGQSNGQIAVKNSAGTLRAWMGEQQPGQGDGSPLWGGWFGQIWIGGTNPLDAPLWVDNQGIIQVGGIAAAKGSRYPYISVRDQTGLEMGRIGAALTVPSQSSGDNVGTNPPQQLTAGAWFTQLAVGGQNLSNWNILIVPDTDPTNPLGSQFMMRNIRQLTVDYQAHQGSPANPEYKLEFGNAVWMAAGLTGGIWQFPGIHIYEVDTHESNFGATYLNRGMVLRGTYSQGAPTGKPYPVLASLVTYNGTASGSDDPFYFWGELALYTKGDPFRQTVYLAAANANDGNPQFLMQDAAGNLQFRVDTNGNVAVAGLLQGRPTTGSGATTPVNAYAYNVSGTPVIDAAGNWVGKPIASGQSQTPWTQSINGNGFALVNTGTVQSGQFMLNNGQLVINANGAFVGPGGIDVGSQGIGCSYLSTTGRGNPNKVDTGTLAAAVAISCSGNIDSTGGYTGGSFRGAGVSVGGNGISCGALSTFGVPPNTPNGIDTQTINAAGNVNVSGNVNSNQGYVGGSFRGNGVDVGNNGISGGSLTARGPDNGSNPTCNVGGTVNCTRVMIGGIQRINTNGIYTGGLQYTDHVYGGDFGIYNQYVGSNVGFYDRDSNFHPVHGGIITTGTSQFSAIVCDQCGNWEIQHRRKNPAPVQKIKLSDWAKAPKAEPGALQPVEMVAECLACHFTVEYSKLESS